jgi:universal stress protein E
LENKALSYTTGGMPGVKKLTSILVVVERSDYAHRGLAKAVVLARHFGARLELFLCDAEHAHQLRRLYDPRGVEEAKAACLADARRYLESMSHFVAARDIEIELDVACESPMYEGVLRKVLRSRPDLVIKTLDASGPSEKANLNASDWQLVRTCPVPLMITRGHPWHPLPRFAAAVDVSSEESPGMSRAILHTAEYLALGCKAELDVIYSERGPTGHGVHSRALRETALRSLAHEFRVDAEHVRLLCGEPAQTLPRFVSEHDYDVLALGALTHRRALAALVGTLTRSLLDTLECDFVLVKPASYRCPVEARPAVASSLTA